MKLFELRFFYSKHRRKIITTAIVVPIAVLLSIVFLPPVISSISDVTERNRFLNMSRADMLDDFEYLMYALEENWPFFNLSVSANDVDVQVLAQNVRDILNDPSIEINGPHGFLDMLRENFIWPIDNLGHFRAIWQYEEYFDARNEYSASPLWFNSLFNQQTVMFYETLRDAGGSQLTNPYGRQPQDADLPVLRTDILKEGHIAYLQINHMIHILWDSLVGVTGMRYYETMLHYFHQEIKGFDHLIIDLRGNSGGMSLHFDVFVAGPLLAESIRLPSYIFFKDGYYSNRAVDALDLTGIVNLDVDRIPVEFDQPLPYLDTNIEFGRAFISEYMIWAGHYYAEWYISMSDEVVFDGKIWMLVDGLTASSAEAAAAIFKYTRTATIVGDMTRGIMGTIYDPLRAVLSLPNTGILFTFDVAYFTDIYGRPWQGYGITPNYFNRLGLDALGTVLAMIAENN